MKIKIMTHSCNFSKKWSKTFLLLSYDISGHIIHNFDLEFIRIYWKMYFFHWEFFKLYRFNPWDYHHWQWFQRQHPTYIRTAMKRLFSWPAPDSAEWKSWNHLSQKSWYEAGKGKFHLYYGFWCWGQWR